LYLDCTRCGIYSTKRLFSLQTFVDMFVINTTIDISKWILEQFGYAVFTGARTRNRCGWDWRLVDWRQLQWNDFVCLIYVVRIVAYKGAIKYKIPYILFGIITIEFMNVLRVVGLAILDTHSRAWTEFNHTYTFTMIIYGYIFLLWMVWVNRFADKA
jgi:exosortase/archaeosortase family protein